MLNKEVEKKLNIQVGKEVYSSHLYLAMACWAETRGYNGIAGWLYQQADEEKVHMLRLVRYINERDGKAVIPKVDKPPEDFSSVQKMFEMTLEHEQYISASINEIVAVCEKEKDYTTHNWIQWFVTEQIEEEKSANEILDKLKLVGDNNMYMFDRDILTLRSGGTEGALAEE